MFKLEMGTSTLAEDLQNTISSQQFMQKRQLELHTVDGQSDSEKEVFDQNIDENIASNELDSETGSLPPDDAIEEVFDQPINFKVPRRPAPQPPNEKEKSPRLAKAAWDSIEHISDDEGKKKMSLSRKGGCRRKKTRLKRIES